MSDPKKFDRMLHPDEARAIVLAHSRPLAAETALLTEAYGRVLAVDLIATENHPPFEAATMDGYAVLAEDVSPWREIIGVQTAGPSIDIEVSEGYTIRITTGAPMPRGADAVVQVENIEISEDHVVITQDVVKSGDNIRPVGFDVAIGARVLTSGTTIGAAEVGLIAGFGLSPVPVFRRPRVSVLSTGDELVEPGEPLEPGQIRDSNRFSMIAAVRETGSEVVWAGTAPDDRGELERILRARIAESDVVITSGGVSMGELDLVKAILLDIADVKFQRIFMKPGKPLNFAVSGETLIFGLPGNPVSTLATFEIFIRPALLTMAGRTEIDRPLVPVRLAAATKSADRIEFQRAVVRVTGEGQLVGGPTGSQASSRLVSFVGANALLKIEPRDTRYEAGEIVPALLLGAPLSGG
jgi:molybdenum cofactor synthesis domain-containing protein